MRPAPPPDPDKALTRSLRAVVRAELGRTDPDTPRPRPTFSQVATLAMLSLDATLLYMLADSQPGFSESAILAAAKKVIPAIGGVAFVAYLDDVRDALITLCARWLTKVVAFVLGIVLFVTTVAPLPVNISVLPHSQVTVDGIGSEPLKPGQSAQVVHVRGLGPHRLIVSEQVPNQVPLVDTIDIGALDVIRSMRSDTHAEADRFLIAPARRVSAYQRDTTRYLVVSGRFPDLYLRRMRRIAWVDDTNPANVAVWLPLSKMTGFGPPLPVPEGVFTFRLEPAMCKNADRVDTVKSTMLTINYALICASQDTSGK